MLLWMQEYQEDEICCRDLDAVKNRGSLSDLDSPEKENGFGRIVPDCEENYNITEIEGFHLQ